jgi:hypothetical protein
LTRCLGFRDYKMLITLLKLVTVKSGVRKGMNSRHVNDMHQGFH